MMTCCTRRGWIPGCLLLLLLLGCNLGGRTERTHPNATDHLYELYRERLTVENVSLHQEIILCEYGRIADVIGYKEATRRLGRVLDTVARTESDHVAHQRAEAKLRHAVLSLGGPFCDSVNTVANREHPIQPRTP